MNLHLDGSGLRKLTLLRQEVSILCKECWYWETNLRPFLRLMVFLVGFMSAKASGRVVGLWWKLTTIIQKLSSAEMVKCDRFSWDSSSEKSFEFVGAGFIGIACL